MSLHLIALATNTGGNREVAGVVVAVFSAALYNLGYVLEKQALADLPAVRFHPLSLLRTVAGSSRWLLGFSAMLAGLVFQLVALTMAPVSVVQPVLAGGLIGLVVIGSAVLEERLVWRQRAALILVLAAVVAIAVSARSGGDVARRVPGQAFASLAVPVILVGLLASWFGVSRRLRSGQLELVWVAIGAGLMYGLGAVSEKAVATNMVASGLVEGSLRSLATVYPWLFLAATLI
ncbi:MAG TPA: hypothetical protein VLX59_18210, partial [Acidimicrobiales bacterium]|nr:hypothetical protein [Acidimicrobiales bacterium]